MTRSKTWPATALVAAAAALAAMEPAVAAGPATASDRAAAAEEYKLSCFICHGARGRGDGPAATTLATRPTDLTKLEEENDYVFPFLKVFQVIDGRATIPAHGTREMPVWGRRYLDDVGETRGPYGSETAVRARVTALVEYVRSLQER